METGFVADFDELSATVIPLMLAAQSKYPETDIWGLLKADFVYAVGRRANLNAADVYSPSRSLSEAYTRGLAAEKRWPYHDPDEPAR